MRSENFGFHWHWIQWSSFKCLLSKLSLWAGRGGEHEELLVIPISGENWHATKHLVWKKLRSTWQLLTPFCCDILPSSPPPPPPIVSRSDSTHGFCNMVINWWTVGPWWLQELHVRHQCPKAIYVLCQMCQWGASEYHMSRRLMSSLFLLMGTAGTARLEISMPASEINSTRAS